MTDLSTPDKAREHARAMAGTVIPNMPTIPVDNAKNLPSGVLLSEVVWDETLAAGEYAGRILRRGTRVRLTNLEGDACANVILLNADYPAERLNVADTVKIQWNAYLGKGKMLLSDMGRVMMSIVDDTCGSHDTFCGASNEKTNTAKYGTGANYSPHPNARDRFLIALQKFGLGKKDIPPCLNFFKGVRIQSDGTTMLLDRSSKAGDFVELRAEMNTLLIVANTPHVLDPRPNYTATPLRIIAWRGPITGTQDHLRNSTPETLKAFQNTEDYYNA